MDGKTALRQDSSHKFEEERPQSDDTHTHKVEGSDQPELAVRLGVEGAKPPQASLKK